MSVVELRHEEPGFGFTAPLPLESAYLVGLQLRGVPRHELWLDGKSVKVDPIAPGTTHIYDLERDPACYTPEPFHDLFFHVPRDALQELGDELGHDAVGELRCRDGHFADDPVIRHLGMAALCAMDAQRPCHQAFVDHLMLAFRIHLLDAYRGTGRRTFAHARGLAPWQEHEAKELMRANLVDGIALETLATACRMSAAAFVRGFRRSTGMTPHQWLMERRVDLAMALMRDSGRSLAEIASHAGFADQSHLTRTFSRRMGVSPGAWRRTILARR